MSGEMNIDKNTSIFEVIEKSKSFDHLKAVLSSDPFHIKITENSNYFLLKYNQINSDFSYKLVQQCRGPIFRKADYEIVCRPFDKFFNYGEPNACEIDWASAAIQEKIDGSIIKLWYDRGWNISTNGSINAFETSLPYSTESMTNFGDLFIDAILNMNTENKLSDDFVSDITDNGFKVLDPTFCYLFEIVSKYNRVVIPYEETDVYHIGTRRNDKLGIESNRNIGVKRPGQYFFTTFEALLKYSNILPFDKEGFVVVDRYYNRVKVKSPQYLAIHHLRGEGAVTNKKILNLIFINEEDEFLTYFPEYKDDFRRVKKNYYSLVNRVGEECEEAMEKIINGVFGDRKEYALWVNKERKCAVPDIMFQVYDENIKSREDIKNYLQSKGTDKVLSLMEKLK
jgi:hypothetical protein